MTRTLPPASPTVARRLPFVALALLTVLAACGAPPPPSGGSGAAVSITFPLDGQQLSGTTALAAAGIGGQVQGLTFELAGATVAGRADGTAYLDTRALPDGPALLRASGTVAGRTVDDAVSVVIDNDLEDFGSVGAAGGSLRTADGSIATLPPGALSGNTEVYVEDATQESILSDFNVDYAALGVTFLGALEVDTGGAAVGLPVAVDLAGWAPAVQPGQAVVMFTVGPDVDGDGVGELMFAANAEATESGSVITRPVPRSQVYGVVGPDGLRAQQTLSAKPGEIVTLAGRGFNSTSPLTNVVRYGSSSSPDAETLVHLTTSVGGFDPELELRFAVPALGSGQRTLALHNLTTGYRTDTLTLTVEGVGSAAPALWLDFVGQVETAAVALAATLPNVSDMAEEWLDTLSVHSGATAAAMAANSGLVSTANAATLNGMNPSALSAAEHSLVARHALVLDAIAASVPALAQPSADLATLLVIAASGAASAPSGLTGQQGGGASCSGGGGTPASSISWGNTTGMGAAPPGSCATGNGSGPGGFGGGSIATAAGLDAHALATTSLRGGSFRPVHGAVVSVMRRGSTENLAPFTAITDAAGYFKVPFVPAGEPFTVRAVDTVNGRVATVDGVANGADVATPVQLLFTSTDSGPGSPTASFTISAVPDPDFEGTVYYDFDATASSDDGEIVEYLWNFDGFIASVGDDATTRRGFGRNGSYAVRLTVIDDDGKFGTAQQTLVIDDLPYDYWGTPPVNVGTTAEGATIAAEIDETALAMTPDGRYVAFSVGWNNPTEGVDPAPEDVNGLRDVYRKDLDTGELLLVSEGATDVYTSDERVAISADGRYVAYTSRLRQDDARWRVHVRDMQTGTVETVEMADTDLAIGSASLSADGRTLLYAITNSGGNPSIQGAYVRDLDDDETQTLGVPGADVLALTPSAGHALVKTYTGLYVVDLQTMEVGRADTSEEGVPGLGELGVFGSAISADGRYVVFASAAGNLVDEPLTPYQDHLYLKDMETGAVSVLTRNPKTGAEADGRAGAPVMTWDGRFVYFQSYADNLVPRLQKPGPDPDGCTLASCGPNLLVYEIDSGRMAVVEVGVDHSMPCCTFSLNRMLAGGPTHLAFTSYNAQLVESGTDDYNRVYRAENPLWAP